MYYRASLSICVGILLGTFFGVLYYPIIITLIGIDPESVAIFKNGTLIGASCGFFLGLVRVEANGESGIFSTIASIFSCLACLIQSWIANWGTIMQYPIGKILPAVFFSFLIFLVSPWPMRIFIFSAVEKIRKLGGKHRTPTF